MSKVMICKTGHCTEHDTEWRFHFLHKLQAAGLVERKKKGILKQQIKFLTGKTTLAKYTKVLSHASIHLDDQPVGPVTPYTRLGTPVMIPNTVKLWVSGETNIALTLTRVKVLCC